MKIINAEAAKKLIEQGAKIIDVREPDEYIAERIENSDLNPLSAFDPAAILKKYDEEENLIFLCTLGKRAARACAVVQQMDDQRENNYVLEGGLIAWKQSGYSTISG